MYDIAVDIGGTFTDCVVHDVDGERIVAAKAPSRRDDLGGGVLDSVRAAAARLGEPVESVLGATERFIHGSTVATNAMIERDGAPTAYVTTAGPRGHARDRQDLPEARGPVGARDVAPEPAVDGRPAADRARARVRRRRARRLPRPRRHRPRRRRDRGDRRADPRVRGDGGRRLPAVELPVPRARAAAGRRAAPRAARPLRVGVGRRRVRARRVRARRDDGAERLPRAADLALPRRPAGAAQRARPRGRRCC